MFYCQRSLRFGWSTDNALPFFVHMYQGFFNIAAIVFVCIHICVYLSICQRSAKIYNLESHQVLCAEQPRLELRPLSLCIESIKY